MAWKPLVFLQGVRGVRLRLLRDSIQGHVPARVWGFESPLRHQLVTDQRLLRYYLMRPSLRPIFGDFGGSFPRS